MRDGITSNKLVHKEKLRAVTPLSNSRSEPKYMNIHGGYQSRNQALDSHLPSSLALVCLFQQETTTHFGRRVNRKVEPKWGI